MGEGESPLVTPYDLTPGGPSSADLGSDRVTAIAAAAARCRIGGDPSPGRRMRAKPGSSTRGSTTHPRVRPDLVVRATDALGDFPVVDPSWADELVSDGVVHLSSSVAGTAATIGPLVVPGASACLHCLDLNRRDRDPGWPHVVAASSQAARRLRRDGPAVSVALSSAAAAITAQQVLEYLDGYPSTALTTWNAVLLCRLPGPTLTRGSVGRHPQCGCAWGPPDRMSGSDQSQWAGE